MQKAWRRRTGVVLAGLALPLAITAIVMAEISAIDLAPYVPLSGVLALLSAAGGLLIVSSIWGTSAVLLHLADAAGPAKVELRLDAVKTV